MLKILINIKVRWTRDQRIERCEKYFQPPMTNLRLDDRSPLHPTSSGPALSASSNVSTPQQQTHRVGNQQPQQQQHQQQRAPRGGAVQRGKEVCCEVLAILAGILFPIFSILRSRCRSHEVTNKCFRWRSTWHEAESVQRRSSTVPWKLAAQRVRRWSTPSVWILRKGGRVAYTQ